jgi:two-component system CheB/CheR fusion protein
MAHAPDLIISDIKMPVLDGYELIRNIRGVPELSNTPAIALTGLGSKGDVERALAAGFNACLSKPAEPEQIATLIRRLTEKSHAAPAGSNPG